MRAELRYVAVEARGDGYAILELATGEVLERAPNEGLAGKRAGMWERAFTPAGEEPRRVELVARALSAAPPAAARAPSPAGSRPKTKRPRSAGGGRVVVPNYSGGEFTAGQWMPMLFGGAVPPRGSMVVSVYPQVEFRGEFFRVEARCAPFFRVGPLQIGNMQQIPSGWPARAPATLFADTRRWFRWQTAVASQGNQILLTVENTDEQTREFHAVLLGRELHRIERPLPAGAFGYGPAGAWKR